MPNLEKNIKDYDKGKWEESKIQNVIFFEIQMKEGHFE